MAKTAKIAGISYPKMLEMIIESAIAREKDDKLTSHDLKYVELERVRDPL